VLLLPSRHEKAQKNKLRAIDWPSRKVGIIFVQCRDSRDVACSFSFLFVTDELLLAPFVLLLSLCKL